MSNISSVNNDEHSPFGILRQFFWPIHNFELKKLLPMLFLFFFISFNYSILRNIKDALVINAAGSPGADIIPYLKFWCVIPCAILFMIIFTKLSSCLSKQQMFYGLTSFFLGFFVLFAFVLYPNFEAIHPITLQSTWLPEGFIAIFRIWSFSLFFVIAELWGSIILSLMFWGFANEITKVEESKRFYALFGIGANIALEFSGRATSYFAKIGSSLPASMNAEKISIVGLLTLCCISSVIIMALYRWISLHVLTDPKFHDSTKVKVKKKKEQKSLKDSFVFLFKSKYLMYIAMLVIAYGVSINLIEVTWKNQLKELYPSTIEYLAFQGMYNRLVGWTTVIMMLFVSGNVLRKFGWTITALITPVTLLISGMGFFGCLIFKEQLGPVFIMLGGMTPLLFAVIFGTFQNVISKSSKYSLFDPTKEMAYIPLDDESKTNGKAAVDVVASRLGKAGGSLILQMLLLIGPLATITPHVAFIVFFIIFAWMFAVKKLGIEFSRMSSGNMSA